LVGDAGVHKDRFLALGVCDALRDAELLTSAIDDGFWRFEGIRKTRIGSSWPDKE
jgi:hypothetical protein